MRYTGATRYHAARESGRIGVPIAQRTALESLPERRFWRVLKPAYAAGVFVGSLGILATYAAAALAKAPFVAFPRRHATIVTGLSKAVVLAGTQIEVTYDPGFDPTRPSVFCQNHVSVLDGPLAAAVIPQPFCGLMNHWHFHVPGYGWLMQLGKSIPVYPRESGRTNEITTEARKRAAEGISILVFPEGHRTPDGGVRPFKRGVLFMARDASIPVVPVAVRGLYDVNHKGQWTFEPGPVQVYIGPQIETRSLDDAAVGDLAERLTRFADVWVREGRAAVEVLP